MTRQHDKQNYKTGWLTFNDYNTRLVNFIKRISEGRSSHLGGGPKKIYQNLTWHDEPKTVQYTKQIIAELKISDYKN